MEKTKNALRINRARCIIALIFSIIMASTVFIGVVKNIMSTPDEYVKEVGYKTFRMFTVLSNMLVATCAVLAIPFEIDGLRHRNYHLPRWIIELIFVGATGVSLTFFVTICILAPYAGFNLMLFQRSPSHSKFYQRYFADNGCGVPRLQWFSQPLSSEPQFPSSPQSSSSPNLQKAHRAQKFQGPSPRQMHTQSAVFRHPKD